MLLQACLGIRIDGGKGEIEILDPRLPIGIDRLWVDGLRVGEAKVDLNFERIGGHVAVHASGGDVPVRLR
jgi:hypothetical protein